ncbi:hypothetical protein [Aneurinibacillus tyrosinisolvens]|uniref:hypothetical protein n=1 Tax=Aneurinibacillus tyrosinisolvens TaxID=1443435 RepID=UPI00063F3AB9|nr:hypothetical protein [Aneurinibacillus tyrosinisolvens]
MSLRAIELQIAIPKTQDIGKVHEHLQERPQQEQAMLAHVRQEKEQINRTRTLETEQTEKGRKERQKHGEAPKKEGKPGAAAGKEPDPDRENLHPYAGHHIDISF